MKNKKWFDIVCIEKNEDYILGLLRKFDIKQYNFSYFYSHLGLLFTYNDDSYKCEILDELECIALLKKNKTNNIKQKEYYHIVTEFYGYDSWYNLFKFVCRKGRKQC